jgi:hypothetical protein
MPEKLGHNSDANQVINQKHHENNTIANYKFLIVKSWHLNIGPRAVIIMIVKMVFPSKLGDFDSKYCYFKPKITLFF